jgi:hypothetical protein
MGGPEDNMKNKEKGTRAEDLAEELYNEISYLILSKIEKALGEDLCPNDTMAILISALSRHVGVAFSLLKKTYNISDSKDAMAWNGFVKTITMVARVVADDAPRMDIFDKENS